MAYLVASFVLVYFVTPAVGIGYYYLTEEN